MNPTPPPVPSPLRGPSRHVRRSALITSGVIILVYAGFFRWAFATPWMKGAGGVVSLSFILSVPFACGAISVAIGRWLGSDKWIIHAIVLPAFTLLIGLVLCLFTKLEAMICIIMAAPILFGGVLLGGLIAHFLLPRNRPPPHLQVTLAVFLPFVAAWSEAALDWPSETKAISNTIIIQAPAARVWPEISSVRAINPAMLPASWIYHIGFPRPIAATLDHGGVGGVRIATFERGVSFFETVTEWDPPRTLAFTIHADPDFIPQTAFDRHIIVGGRFYDVLDGTYEIEPLSPHSCRLHLTSTHRLSTRFNSYAAWWSVRIMNQIQGSILEVIRQRAENPADRLSP